MYGRLIKELKRLGLWPGPISPGNVHGCLSQLLDDLESMTCFVLDGTLANAHVRCKYTIFLRQEIEDIESDMSSGNDDPLRKHIQEQAKK